MQTTDATILRLIGAPAMVEMFEHLDAGNGKPDQVEYLRAQYELQLGDAEIVIRAWEATKGMGDSEHRAALALGLQQSEAA